MRALWLVRTNLRKHPGGDTTQILQTAAALRTQGVEVDLCDHPDPDYHRADVVHLFHLDRLWENARHAERINAAGRPAVLSTIYWPADEFDRHARAGFQGWLARRAGSTRYQNLRLLQRHLLACAQQRRWPTLRPRHFDFRLNARRLLETVAVLLPNSRIEADEIATRFGTKRPAVVVPNAADTQTFFPPEPNTTRDGVLCVGRIEPRKNQLTLLRALRGTGIPLTLVGQPGRYSRPYYARCRREADPSTRFVEHQSPDQLRELYQAARVHVCPSWYETPGLASLEAALCGCALVVSPGGSTPEYFADQAHYVEPADQAGLRAAIQHALSAGPPPGLAHRVAEQFNWSQAAAATLTGYRQALGAADRPDSL